MNNDQIDLIDWIEEFYMEEKRFPARKEILDEFSDKNWSHENLESLLEDPIVLNALDRRGISPNNNPHRLSGEQIAAISLMLDTADRRTAAQKLKSLGISSQRWGMWNRNPKFSRYYSERAEERLRESKPTVMAALIQNAEAGHMDAIKFHMEVSGRHNPRSTESINFQMALTRIMDAIQYHVKDPETLRAIALDFEAIMENKPLPSQGPPLQIENREVLEELSNQSTNRVLSGVEVIDSNEPVPGL
jgi:hypothetical protein